MYAFFSSFRLFPLLGWLLLIMAPLACIDPEAIVLSGTNDILVVDGTITNLAEPQIIRINRSQADRLTGRFGTVPVTKASMEVVVDSAQIIPCHETVDGSYQLPSDFKGQIGHAYQLRFTLSDGTRYVSTQQVMPPVPLIDKITARFKSDALPAQLSNGSNNQYRGAHQLAIDWQDPINQHNYYRWDWKLWEKQDWCRSCVQGFYELYNPTDKSKLYEDCYAPPEYQTLTYSYNYNGQIYYFVNDYPCRSDCWEILFNSDISLYDDQYSNGGRITSRPVALIPYYQGRGCLVEIRQTSLTQSAYRYFNLLQAQTQNTGGLTDTPPTALIGNIQNLTNSQEKIVGYFTATAVSANRYWLDRKDATGKTPGLFVALNGLLPSPEDEPDPNTGHVKPRDPYANVLDKLPTALCVSGDNRTPFKPLGWQDRDMLKTLVMISHFFKFRFSGYVPVWLLLILVPLACVDPEDIMLRGTVDIIVVDGTISNLAEE